MANRIEHKGLGIEFDVPEMTQRQVENWVSRQRRLRRERVTVDDDSLQLAADAVAHAVRTVQDKKYRASSPEAAAAVEIAARVALRIGADYTAGTELSPFESAGDGARAAASLGWLGDVKPDDIDDWTPAKTAYVTGAIVKLITQAQEIPPN
jgi:hypothetical protein